MLDAARDFQRFLGDPVGHRTHQSVTRLLTERVAQIHVVHVTARAVRHDADEGRILPVGAEQLLNAVGEDAEIVRADVAGGNSADVM